MLRKLIRITASLTLFLAGAALLILGLPMAASDLNARVHTCTVEEVPQAPVAIVFGAGLTHDGTPGAVLRDRVHTAADLYFAGKVEKLLLSGDNRTVDYNEPAAMQDYALELGIPAADIVLDYAGLRTYDTCYRAGAIFEVRDAILVTQAYPLPRALVTCRGLGVDSSGVIADRREYNPASFTRWRIREVPATLVAFLDVFLIRPLPILGNPEPIFSSLLTPDRFLQYEVNHGS